MELIFYYETLVAYKKDRRTVVGIVKKLYISFIDAYSAG